MIFKDVCVWFNYFEYECIESWIPRAIAIFILILKYHDTRVVICKDSVTLCKYLIVYQIIAKNDWDGTVLSKSSGGVGVSS